MKTLKDYNRIVDLEIRLLELESIDLNKLCDYDIRYLKYMINTGKIELNNLRSRYNKIKTISI